MERLISVYIYVWFESFVCVFNYSVCEDGIFTCTNESCDGESCDLIHSQQRHKGPSNIIFIASYSYCTAAIDLRDIFKTSETNFKMFLELLLSYGLLPVFMIGSERSRVSECCVFSFSGLWVEQLVSVELLLSVLWIWTAVLQPDDTAPSAVRRTGVWGAVTHITSLQGPWMWWETQCWGFVRCLDWV